MTKRIYKKTQSINVRKVIRFSGLGLCLVGLLFGLFTLSPLLSWELYLKPAFASSNFASPIPQTTLLTKEMIRSLLTNTTHAFHDDNWLPTQYKVQIQTTSSSYFLSIPKLDITNAIVSTIDTYINSHLINFPGTAIPPDKGNAVVFGH